MVIKLSGKVPVDFLISYDKRKANEYFAKANEYDINSSDRQYYTNKGFQYQNNAIKLEQIKDTLKEIEVPEEIYNEYAKSNFSKIMEETINVPYEQKNIEAKKQQEQQQVEKIKQEIVQQDTVYNLLDMLSKNKIVIVILAILLILILRR